ncbi:MAG: Rieske (2Fe-2S) protein [bacterium]|jgi:nitrite reductase/ring-hydroxylating ferredoxin subunit|nr:Rieske (2Fe-2S) protein [Chloroflexota bacterium]NBO52088.1 Rieske (2Fe-2S) protein [Candidatus Aquidulcis sp.]
MPSERLFPAAELPDGTMRLAWPGGVAILVVNRGGTLHAVDGVCTHEYCELDRGFLSPALAARPTVTCPLHLSRFDLESGQPLDPPADAPLGVHSVTVDEQGWVVLLT